MDGQASSCTQVDAEFMPEALTDLVGLPCFGTGTTFNYRCKNKQVMARQHHLVGNYKC